jgi:class 3 adenylate cyclase
MCDHRLVAEASLVLAPSPTGIADLLEAHPWPREYAAARRLEWLWTIDVPVPPARLWPLIADLSRLNRAMGLPPMRFEERDGIRWGRARYTGVLHEWTEVPWNWVAGRWYELVRLYRKGSMRALFGVYDLEPLGADATRLRIYYGIVPRSRLLDLGLRWTFSAMGRAYQRLLPRIAAEAARAPEPPPSLREPPPPLRPEAAGRLDQLAQTLRDAGLDADAVRLLADWVRTADDLELERIRVRERARAWGIDEDSLLRLFLHATRAGLLELSWDVVCPHCRGVRESTSTLGALPTQGSCAACGIEFGTDTAEAVEIAFHAHSSIRPITRATFCSAEASHKDHIRVQRAVAAGDAAEVSLPTEPGRYRLRLAGEMTSAWLEIAPGGAASIEWRASAAPDGGAARPGGRLRLINDRADPVMFVVEVAAWLDLALRPGRLLSFQEFRDLFSEEYLGADVQLAVGEQTILFTDVVGSTAMYADRGDPAAFVAVKQHFDTLFGIIAGHRGAVVKTIGDAAMGAFNDPIDAIRAARAIHGAFPPGGGDDAIRLRISVNTGPCIAVRLNANIDYFGHAVNLAAKLQAAAGAWQVAMSEATWRAPGVAAWLDAEAAALEDVTVAVKGVAGPVSAKRWTVAAAP